MSTDVPVHHYTCSVYFFFFGITCAMTFQLIYWGTYTQIHPKINVPVYPHASLPSNHKDLPVSTTTCVPAHRCTRSWPYLFIFILYFRLNAKIYPSTFLQRCMTLFIFMFLFRLTTKTYLLPHVLVYLPIYIYIYPFMSYLFIFILQLR